MPNWIGAIIHHTASPRNTTVADIDRWHKQRGWRKIGYHRVIYPDGTVHDGRSLAETGAHARGYNETHVGIALTGNFDEYPPTDQQYFALRQLLQQLGFGKDQVLRHRDVMATSCPGANFDLAEVWAGIRIVVNGKTLQTEAENRGGMVWVPIRDVAKALGAKVSWHSPPPTVHIQTKGVVIGGIHLPPER